jgi:glycerol-3-phosphate cytidylyltransferase-like family protein
VEFLLISSFGIGEIESPSILIRNTRSNATIVTNCVDKVLIGKSWDEKLRILKPIYSRYVN